MAFAALVAAGVSDLVIGSFWSNHPMLTAIVSALVVILLSAAVIDVILRRRDESRWRVLAQAALIQLAELAHAVWSDLADGLAPGALSNRPPAEVLEELGSAPHASAIHQQVAASLADTARRDLIEERLSAHVATSQQLLTRWAVPMTASERYAAIFDRHVEMFGRVEGLLNFIRHGHRMSDPRAHRGQSRRQYLAAGGEREDEWFLDNVLATLSVAASLEDDTWQLALRVVPESWWDERTLQLASAAHEPPARSRPAHGRLP